VTTVRSVRAFLGVILKRATDSGRVIAYRGLSDESYPLKPSIFRDTISREQEHNLLRELIAAHPDEFAADQSTLEQLVRMQHYALPTRLLDVSWNPLVALYFAAQPTKRETEVVRKDKKIVKRNIRVPGAVAILTVEESKVCYFDSDTVSCIANLAKLKWELKEKIDTSLELRKFNDTMPIRRLLHFIRQEKYQFEGEIVPNDLDKIILVKPKLSNKRILAQNGAFFLFGRTVQIREPNSLGIRVDKIGVPVEAKQRILDELNKLNINEKTLFPEIERAARYLTSNLQSELVSSIVSKT
jgi:hypothetical protein